MLSMVSFRVWRTSRARQTTRTAIRQKVCEGEMKCLASAGCPDPFQANGFFPLSSVGDDETEPEYNTTTEAIRIFGEVQKYTLFAGGHPAWYHPAPNANGTDS